MRPKADRPGRPDPAAIRVPRTRRLVALSRMGAPGWDGRDDATWMGKPGRAAVLLEGALEPGCLRSQADGASELTRARVVDDLARLLRTARGHRVPLVLTDCEGVATNEDLAQVVEQLGQAARREGLRCATVTILAQQDPAYIATRLTARRHGGTGSRVADLLEPGAQVTAAMGAEPLVEALACRPDVIVAGHCVEGAAVAAAAIAAGFDRGLAWHMASILSGAGGRGGFDAPAGTGWLCDIAALAGTLERDHFTVEPADPRIRCGATAVAARSLAVGGGRPRRLPGGVLELADARFEPLSARRVRVTGGRFVERPYAVELRTAPAPAARAIGTLAVREGTARQDLDGLLAAVQAEAARALGAPGSLHLRRYDAAADAFPGDDGRQESVGVVVEAAAGTGEEALALLMRFERELAARCAPGGTVTVGRRAVRASSPSAASRAVPSNERSGPRLLRLDDPLECFAIRHRTIGVSSEALRAPGWSDRGGHSTERSDPLASHHPQGPGRT